MMLPIFASIWFLQVQAVIYCLAEQLLHLFQFIFWCHHHQEQLIVMVQQKHVNNFFFGHVHIKICTSLCARAPVYERERNGTGIMGGNDLCICCLYQAMHWFISRRQTMLVKVNRLLNKQTKWRCPWNNYKDAQAGFIAPPTKKNTPTDPHTHKICQVYFSEIAIGCPYF